MRNAALPVDGGADRESHLWLRSSDRLGGGEDDFGGDVWLRDHRDVRRFDLDGGGVGALGHEPLGGHGIAWSCVVTRYQDGMVFQAGSPDTEAKASCENGRCVACI